jgi:hypothetical protein
MADQADDRVQIRKIVGEPISTSGPLRATEAARIERQ